MAAICARIDECKRSLLKLVDLRNSKRSGVAIADSIHIRAVSSKYMNQRGAIVARCDLQGRAK